MAQIKFEGETIIEEGTTIYCAASEAQRSADIFVTYFDNADEANAYAERDWNHLTASEQIRTRVWVYALKCTKTTTWEDFSEWDEYEFDGSFDSEKAKADAEMQARIVEEVGCAIDDCPLSAYDEAPECLKDAFNRNYRSFYQVLYPETFRAVLYSIAASEDDRYICADRLGISRDTLEHLESGETQLTDEQMIDAYKLLFRLEA